MPIFFTPGIVDKVFAIGRIDNPILITIRLISWKDNVLNFKLILKNMVLISPLGNENQIGFWKYVTFVFIRM